MRVFAIVLVLLGCCGMTAALAAQSNDCKLCRDDLRACVRNHSQGACKSEYEICMKHCRRK
jgi:hypothetical protein